MLISDPLKFVYIFDELTGFDASSIHRKDWMDHNFVDCQGREHFHTVGNHEGVLKVITEVSLEGDERPQSYCWLRNIVSLTNHYLGPSIDLEWLIQWHRWTLWQSWQMSASWKTHPLAMIARRFYTLASAPRSGNVKIGRCDILYIWKRIHQRFADQV